MVKFKMLEGCGKVFPKGLEVQTSYMDYMFAKMF